MNVWVTMGEKVQLVAINGTGAGSYSAFKNVSHSGPGEFQIASINLTCGIGPGSITAHAIQDLLADGDINTNILSEGFGTTQGNIAQVRLSGW